MGKPISLDIAYLIIQYNTIGNIAMLISQVILMLHSAICGLDMKTVQNMWQFCKLECRSGQFFFWKKCLSRGQKSNITHELLRQSWATIHTCSEYAIC